jgi:hypothetical protein
MAKSRKKIVDVMTDTPAVESPLEPGTIELSTIEPNTIERDRIAERAYELYVSRGREGGHELEDWLAAERELTAADKD